MIVAEHHEYDQLTIPWTEERSDFYWAGSIPHVRIDGIYLKVGASSCYSAAAEYRSLIEQRLAETGGQSPVSVTGGYWFDGDSLRVTASYQLLEAGPLVDLQAHVMILEDDIYCSGQYFHHVTRAARSTDVVLEVAGQSAFAQAAFAIDAAWNPNHLSCAVCLQRMGEVNEEKEIHQAALLGEGHAGVPGPEAPMAGLRLSAWPNPFVPAQHGGGLRVEVRLAAEAGGSVADTGPPGASVPNPAGAGTVFCSCGPWFSGPLELYDAGGRCVARTSPLSPGGDGQVLTATWDGRALTGRPLEGGVYWLKVPRAPAERFLLLR